MSIAGNEGKVGIAAIVPQGDGSMLETVGHLAQLARENLNPAGCPRVYRVKAALPITDTFKYKKAELSKEGIAAGDYFVDKSGNVQPLDSQGTVELLAGMWNEKV